MKRWIWRGQRAEGFAVARTGGRGWRTVKWAGSVISLILLIGNIVASRCYAGYINERFGLALFRGWAEITWRTHPAELPPSHAPRFGWHFKIHDRWTFRTTFFFFDGFAPYMLLYVPPWAPLTAALLPTLYAWHRCRARKLGHCPKCGYDLAGLKAGVCPECGAKV